MAMKNSQSQPDLSPVEKQQYRRLIQAIISTDPGGDRQAEKERERAQRRINAVWSECQVDELPAWADEELEREAAELGEADRDDQD